MKDLVVKVKEEVMKEIQKFKEEDVTHYDFWNEHIKYVLNEAIHLAEKYHANLEIVKLGALLHDIALIKKVGTRSDHHINGAKIAEEILDKYQCSKEMKERIVNCVLHHRSSKNAESVEEICVCDADVLAHFDNLPMVFYNIFSNHDLSLQEAKEKINAFIEKDYNDLSERTKEDFIDQYRTILSVVKSRQILNEEE